MTSLTQQPLVPHDKWVDARLMASTSICGEEAMETYRHRPSFEDKMLDIWYFDVNFECYIQEEERLARRSGSSISVIDCFAYDTTDTCGVFGDGRPAQSSLPRRWRTI